jgi:Kef-type K+ transport system membrane component KefB
LLDVPLLQDLGLLIIGATLLSLLAQRAHIPSIVAFILAGLALGPGLNLVERSEKSGDWHWERAPRRSP